MVNSKNVEAQTINAAKKYIGSYTLYLIKIEVYSFSGHAVPYYYISNNEGKEFVAGGIRIGNLSGMGNPMIEARCSKHFLASVFSETLLSEELPEDVSTHKKVAEMDCKKSRVLVDAYDAGNDVEYLQVGASAILYNRTDDGKISIPLDGEMIEEMQF